MVKKSTHLTADDRIRIDLPGAVKCRPRRKTRTQSVPPVSKEGHLYKDYLANIKYNDTPTVQMDCVEGTLCLWQSTYVFFCDPNRSDQKAMCENNHGFLRDIIPGNEVILNPSL